MCRHHGYFGLLASGICDNILQGVGDKDFGGICIMVFLVTIFWGYVHQGVNGDNILGV